VERRGRDATAPEMEEGVSRDVKGVDGWSGIEVGSAARRREGDARDQRGEKGQEKGVGWPEEHEENVQYRSDSVHTRWAREHGYPVWASCRF